jgi:beta-mannosidase
VRTQQLITNWHVQECGTTEWLPAKIPGTIHQDLINAARIPDPYLGLHERDVQWIGERDWLYRCMFDVSADMLRSFHVDLCFDGLDTVATVQLNGQTILTSDNMFVPHRIPIKNLLREGTNELTVLLDSPVRHSLQREEKYGARPAWNPNPHRLFLRKAQYHYGWDWGPILITSGIWRDVRLEAYDARIVDMHIAPEVAADLGSATIPVTLTGQAGEWANLSLIDPDGNVIDETIISGDTNTFRHTFTVNTPRLWYPNGYGDQPLYTVRAKLRHDSHVVDEREIRIGLRRLRLVQEPLIDEPGRTFLFEINNTPIFGGGANWIPADSFTPRVDAERYRRWIKLAAEANMVMLRIWGGGIYEEDVFYDLCDQYGIMVWQDFMFACGMYPAHESFLASVRAEAEANVIRLRHHPSIVLWCGNNEDYQIAESKNAYDPAFNGDFVHSEFPAREIYERLLPEVCAANDPTRPYWQGSPYSGQTLTPDPTVGDRHSWEVWHANMDDYRNYTKYSGRFVSEFGMQSFPVMSTIEAAIEPNERYIGSRTMDFHNKGDRPGMPRLMNYVLGNLRVPVELEDLVYGSQLIQAEALSSAYSLWRRQWRGAGRYAVAGALVWQLNDCYPVVSWALVDYYLRPKPAYYVTKRKLAHTVVEMARNGDQIEVWASTVPALDVEYTVCTYTLDGVQLSETQHSAHLAANQTTELTSLNISQYDPTVVAVKVSAGGKVVARAVLFPEPFKYFSWSNPGFALERLDGDRVRIRVQRPAKGVWLQSHDGVTWSDNMLDLLPGDPQEIAAAGLGDGKIHIRSLGGYTATF